MSDARDIAERIVSCIVANIPPHIRTEIADHIESALLAERRMTEAYKSQVLDIPRVLNEARLAERRRAIEECAKEGIACAHELKRNADLEAEDSPERCALLSEALIAFDVVARIRSLASPREET